MILQALCRLGEQEQLIEDPDYEVRPVAWVVELDREGRLKNLVDRRRNLSEGTKRKPKWEGKPLSVPRQPIRTSGDAAFFLVDKSEYVFGFDPNGARPPEKLHTRLQLFREQVEVCYGATGDDAVGAVMRFLMAVAEDRAAIKAAFEKNPWAANELFAFQVGLGSEFVHLRPVVREFWKGRRNKTATAESAETLQCLVTGRPLAEAGLFPLLKRVPGGTSSGVALVSFNAKAFESYGLSGNENAPVSREAAEQASTALNRLLHDAYPNPLEAGTALPRRNVRVGDTAVCYWAASMEPGVQAATNALFGLLEAETEESVGEIYRSVWHGREVVVEKPTAFFVLILSGAQGRAIVRDWIETTLNQTMGHLAQHFLDLEIVRHAPPKAGSAQTPAVPLRWLMEALAPEGKSESVPASLEAGFLRAALTGVPYPLQILQRALVRARVETGRDDWIDKVRRDARAALIRAVLNRRRRDPQVQPRYPEVSPDMNPQVESEGYRLGLLMAVLERLQVLALGDINASIVDRYFSAASATPRAVFVRLLRNARHHARKAADADEEWKRGVAFRLERLVDDLARRFQIDARRYPPGGGGLPAHLDLEQQGLFVLGYHHMRHWLWLSGDERSRWETEHADCPAAYHWTKREDRKATAAAAD